jgi:hypothetical protein
MGNRSHLDCAEWKKVTINEKQSEETPGQPAVRVPWSGSALGLSDLISLTPRGRHILIGVLGAHDSGKTTLLIGSYLQLLQGRSFGDATFAGSRTLGALESLAAWVRFQDAAIKPTFPPHTPRGTGRVPGLLHFSLRNRADEFRDILLTDAPGEWFSRWSVKDDAQEAEGAQWIADNADAFLVAADCVRLSGEDRGAARKDLRQLIERLGNHAGNRPVILVWTKSDCTVNERMRTTIQDALRQNLPHAIELTTTIADSDSFAAVVEQIIQASWNAPVASAIQEPVASFDPFHTFRGRHG